MEIHRGEDRYGSYVVVPFNVPTDDRNNDGRQFFSRQAKKSMNDFRSRVDNENGGWSVFLR